MSGNYQIDNAVISRVQAMCEESLCPDHFDMWETVKAALFETRSSLNSETVAADTQACVDAVCNFVLAYEKRKYEVMEGSGSLLSVGTFMVDYCQSLRQKEPAMKIDISTVTLHGITVQVEFEYTPPHKGKRDSLGAHEEPDEPATIEIVAVRHSGVDIIELLSPSVLKGLEEEIKRGE